MGSHSVTCHPAEVTFPPLPQPKLVLARLSNPVGMQGRVDLVVLLHAEMAHPPEDGHPLTHPGTNRARRALTSFLRRMPLTTTPRRQPVGLLSAREWKLKCAVTIEVKMYPAGVLSCSCFHRATNHSCRGDIRSSIHPFSFAVA